jgi:probable DNA repair protein
MPPELAQRLAGGGVAVTPNRRLAAWLAREYDRMQLASGRAVWPTADCLPLSAFYERLYAELTCCAPGALLLTEHQEQVLWEEVVAGSREGRALLHPEAAARNARATWRIQHAYRLDLESQRATLDEDASAYLGWTQRYREIARARGWLDRARLADAVALALESGMPARPRRIVLYGFDSIPPQQRAVFDTLARHGWCVTEMTLGSRPVRVTRCGYDDRESELSSVAHQVRAILAARADARIGVVVPDLAAARADVVRIFDDILDPARVLGGRRERPRPYNVSLGAPLAAEPLVHTALLILELARGGLALEKAGSLLRSPFLAAAERELANRALLDRRLREEGRSRIEPRLLARHAQGKAPGDPAACPELAARLASWIELAARARTSRLPPSEWSSVFQRLLAGLGWPGERTLDSEEYQAFGKWRETVGSLSTLDAVVPPLTCDEALARLERLVAETVFQPETPEVPVQVLGVLEAHGLEFDHLFVTGLSDEAWPPPPHPAPFLPLALQRAHAVAHATAEWQLAYARRATALWSGAAPEVCFSWPRADGERALGMSPLLAPFVEVEPRCGAFVSLHQAIHRARATEAIADFAAPPLAPGIEVKGGVEFFQDQAACPFRGYAGYRLGARALEAARVGLDARERGRLVHCAAEKLWSQIETSERLAAMSADALAAAVEDAVAAASETVRRRRPDVMTEAFSALERERVAALLLRLARLEKQRAPFRVLQRETPRPVGIGGVHVSTRPDRVDRLGDGSHVVLDYKTSREVDIAGWLGERPDEPQLPLYAASAPEPPAAVAFVQLTAREVRFEGLARAPDLLPGVPKLEDSRKAAAHHRDWGALIEGWRAALEALAREFLAGRAEVAPKDYPETCQHCAFPTLCRVQELIAGTSQEEGS